MSLHANVAAPARDRRRLERPCRNKARPPVATDRLSCLEDGRLLYRLKHRRRNGTTHVVFESQKLLEKLAALAPPPRFHLIRYHGILGPCPGERHCAVPGSVAAQERARLSPPGAAIDLAGAPASNASGPDRDRVPTTEMGRPPSPRDRSRGTPASDGPDVPRPAPDEPTACTRRRSWAELLRRVFALDVLECPRCAGRMRPLAAIHPPDATQAILDGLDLPSRTPPVGAARPHLEGPDGSAGEIDAGL